MRTAILFIFAIAAGCLRVDVDNNVLKCSSNPKRLCPEGYFCAANNTCWKNGSTPPSNLHSPRQGSACARDSECDSLYCVDGVCCDSACTGQCQACDIGGTGVCTTVTGAPHGFRQRCASLGADPCAIAACDGSDANACHLPGTSTVCVAQACIPGTPPVWTPTWLCNGAGQCVSTTDGGSYMSCPTPPNATATCSGDACDFVCNAGYVKQGSDCVAGP